MRLGKSVCVMQYRRSLYAEYAICVGHQFPGGAPYQLLKKQKKTKHNEVPKSAPAHDCGWMQIIIIDGQLCLWKDISNLAPRKEKEKKMKPVHHFQVYS